MTLRTHTLVDPPRFEYTYTLPLEQGVSLAGPRRVYVQTSIRRYVEALPGAPTADRISLGRQRWGKVPVAVIRFESAADLSHMGDDLGAQITIWLAEPMAPVTPDDDTEVTPAKEPTPVSEPAPEPPPTPRTWWQSVRGWFTRG